jgi:hypothetical protein
MRTIPVVTNGLIAVMAKDAERRIGRVFISHKPAVHLPANFFSMAVAPAVHVIEAQKLHGALTAASAATVTVMLKAELLLNAVVMAVTLVRALAILLIPLPAKLPAFGNVLTVLLFPGV